MKNYTRVERSDGRIKTFRLIDDAGDPVLAFDLFVDRMVQEGLRALTVETYSNHVASFLDYLVEAKVFGFPCSELEMIDAIKAYLPARLAGANARGKYDTISRQTLGQKKLKKASAKNHAAAINKFLFESDNHALHMQQVEDWEAGAISKTPHEAFQTSSRRRSNSEVRRIYQSSMMVNVMNHHPTAAAGRFLKVQGKNEQEYRDKDFPAEYVLPLSVIR